MNTLKAQWTVTAGVLTDIPMIQYTKIFAYTGEMYGKDQYGSTHYHDMLAEVHDYARKISNPGIVRWVHVKFIWI